MVHVVLECAVLPLIDVDDDEWQRRAPGTTTDGVSSAFDTVDHSTVETVLWTD